MNPFLYLKEKGIRHAWNTIFNYKIDIVIQNVLRPFLNKRPLENIIVIESHNDFDCNGGAFYNYLIDNGYNKKYKIVWLIKHLESLPHELPSNVDCVFQYKPGIKKNYYRWIAKYFIADQECYKKMRGDQISIYTTHGSIGLKDVTGLMNLPEDLNYCLTASDFFAPFDAKMYLWNYPNKKLKICGFPAHDVFYNEAHGDLNKVGQFEGKKIILWMPTFRKSIEGRQDSDVEQMLGIPLINNIKEYNELNTVLANHNILLIIKLHPKQDLDGLKIEELSNIKILTAQKVKDKGIDIYRLMKDVDALISDYSSAAYDFLHLNRPIAYDFSDLQNYTRGLIVDDPHEMIAGHELYLLSDMIGFIEDVSQNIDPYGEARRKLFNKLFKYHDGNSCKRVSELLGLEK